MEIKQILEELEKLGYNYSEQQRHWDSIKGTLGDKDKLAIAKILIDDIFSYRDLVSAIIYDIASTDKEYLDLLDQVIKKIKADLAQGSFITALIRIGSDKSKIGLQIFDAIAKLHNDDLVIYSGLILGGYGKKNEEDVIERIKTNIETTDASGKIAFIRALFVTFEDKGKLSEDCIKIIEDLHKETDLRVRRELANLYLFFYKSDHRYFFKKLSDLTALNISSINQTIFQRLSFSDIIEDDSELTGLIELCRDEKSEDTLHSIAMSLLKVKKVDKIAEIIIHWINKGLYFKISGFEYMLEEIGKIHKEHIVKIFLQNYRSIKAYQFFLPKILVKLGKSDLSRLTVEIRKFYERNSGEDYIVLKSLEDIIASIYTDSRNMPIAKEIFDTLKMIAKNRPFLDIDFATISRNLENKTQKEAFDYIVYSCKKTIERCLTRKQKYDFNTIIKNLEGYKNIRRYLGEEFFKTLEKEERYHPLLWLLESKDFDISELEDMKKKLNLNTPLGYVSFVSYIRGELWPKATLDNRDDILSVLHESEEGIGKIKDSLNNPDEFWETISELNLVYKLRKNGFTTKLRPRLSTNKYLDLETSINGEKVFFEVIRPDLPKNIKYAGGGFIGKVAFKKIYGEFKKHLSGSKEAEENLIFVVIDRSSGIIDEYDISNALDGSLQWTLLIDKKTGEVVEEGTSRAKDSLHDTDKRTEVITGVIYFKEDLILDVSTPKIKLVGDILLHKNSKNVLSYKGLNILKEILFK